MIKDLLSYKFVNKGKRFDNINQYLIAQRPIYDNQRSLISRGGDLLKNSSSLKSALLSIRYPIEKYSEQSLVYHWLTYHFSAKSGHPTEFLKILHYTLFDCFP